MGAHEITSLTAQFRAAVERIAELEAASTTLTEQSADLTAQVAALTAAAETATAEHAAETAELAGRLDEATATILSLEQEKADVDAAVEELKAKLAIAPYGDTSDGADPVPEGGAAADAIDAKAEMERIRKDDGNKAAIAYYREHKDEIDGRG